jgi:D-sedoheptulose 7-phosphate isomerase
VKMTTTGAWLARSIRRPRAESDIKNIGLEASSYLHELKLVIDAMDTGQIAAVVDRLIAVCRRRGNVYVFGNGGSAATGAHLVNDFEKGLGDRSRAKFKCLSDNIPILTAIANDIEYDEVFASQLRGHLTARDLVIGISTRGNSTNVLKGVRCAREAGVESVGFIGYDGGHLLGLVDYPVVVPSYHMQRVEDLHLVLNHLMMLLVRERLLSDLHLQKMRNGIGCVAWLNLKADSVRQ